MNIISLFENYIIVNQGFIDLGIIIERDKINL